MASIRAAAGRRRPSTCRRDASASCSSSPGASGCRCCSRARPAAARPASSPTWRHRLGRRLHTVSCHDDLTAADLTGRYLLKGGETVWLDGPLTRAVREGGICYLDEVVEARKDVTVVLHPLTDDRRVLPLERTGELLDGPARVHARRLLQPRLPEHPEEPEAQHAPALRRDRARLPAPRGRAARGRRRERPEPERVRPLINLAGRLRELKGMDLEEAASTRLLVYAATLIRAGIDAADRDRARA